MKIWFIILSTCLVGSSVIAKPNFEEDVDAMVMQAMQDWGVPGLGLAIIKDGKIIIQKGYGFRDIGKKLPVNKDTLFVGASTSKAFTAFGIGLLVDSGELNWDTPVDRYISGFEMADSDISSQVTPRDMLSHRTGLPRHDYVWYANPDITSEEIVKRLPALEFSQPLRAKWQYNNIMYLTTGYLIETLQGQSWETFTHNNIFVPLGMKRSNFSVKEMAKDSNHATAYTEDEERNIIPIPLREVDNIGPAGSINSSVADYAKWVQMHLNKGKHNNEQLIQAATLSEIMAPHIPVGGKPEFSEFSHTLYALGWFTDNYRGYRRVQHGGNLDGFTARVTLFPDQNMGSVIFVNKEASQLPGVLSIDLTDRILELEPLNFSKKMLERQKLSVEVSDIAKKNNEQERKIDTVHAHSLQDYVGLYQHPGYGLLKITHNTEVNQLEAEYNDASVDLKHWHYEVFQSSPQRPEDDHMKNKQFHFQTDVNGYVTAVKIDMELTVAPIEFAKKVNPSLTDPSFLDRFTGRYQHLNQIWLIDLNGDQLSLTIPGQTRRNLQPNISGGFVFEDLPIIGVEFVFIEDSVSGFKLKQPGAVYEIKRIEDD